MHTFKFFKVKYLYILISYFVLAPADLGAQAFDCDGTVYISQDDPTQLFSLDRSEAPFTQTEIATSSLGYNAIGFNIEDNLIYGIGTSGAESGLLIAVPSTGLGLSDGDPSLPSIFLNGTMDQEGVLYLLNENDSPTADQLYPVDVSVPSTGLAIELTGDDLVGVSDIAFNPKDALLYGTDGNGDLVSINPSTGEATVMSMTGDGPVTSAGAVWFDATGTFFAYVNTGVVYSINVSTATATQLSTAPSLENTDGASCSAAPHLRHSISPTSRAAGQTVTHTYQIDNGLISGSPDNDVGPGDALTLAFQDTLGSGRSFVAASLNITGHTGSPTVNSYGGSNTLSISNLEVPAVSTVTVTVDVLIASTATLGTVTNQASLTVPSPPFPSTILSDGPELTFPGATSLVITPTDEDDDGLTDAEECPGHSTFDSTCFDTDGDGTPDFQDTDSDGDGDSDAVEADLDSDGDGILDYLDPVEGGNNDSDGDGISDPLECPRGYCTDTDNDGLYDYVDTDSDGDGLLDEAECPNSASCPDSDGDGIADFLDASTGSINDSDGDGILDSTESPQGNRQDVDGDRVPDYMDLDSDGDGDSDAIECPDPSSCVDADGDRIPDYADYADDPSSPGDSDSDGINDDLECATGVPCPNISSTNVSQTDSDLIPDYADSDNSNAFSSADYDGDGLTNGQELSLGTDLGDSDSDDDGLSDGDEVNGTGPLAPYGATDPLNPDTDGDGVSDGDEVINGTNPLVAGGAASSAAGGCALRRGLR
ncbi:MAG: hypothetical protein KDK66_03115 [Deltaproteobacteria bacterium]|nr:hypothetical protein [Deltaproteobacteria bacterium]